MRGGVIIIAIALLIAYIGVTGKYKCFTMAFTCLTSDDDPCSGCGAKAADAGAAEKTAMFPTIAPLKPIAPIGFGV